jgi:tRNA nucleotidyltransferase/poly(A) polymerase
MLEMSAGAESARLDSTQAPWLFDGPLPRLLDVLNADGEEGRVVGGAVRNALLGEPVAEVDLATTARPEEIVRRAKAAGFHPVPTGIEHGTVTVVIHGRPFEVTTLREDVETDGRRAKVRFGRDWRRDAERRDFTINGLSLQRDGMVVDFVGGLDDLKARRVRFIGEPEMRIREDYLRVLRFFRFHAGYGEGLPDRAALSACIRARDGLATLSRERIRAELLKLLMAKHAVPVLATMSEAGILGQVLGGVPLLASYSNVVKAEAAAKLPKDAIRHLAGLGVFLTEDSERLKERLRLANAEFGRLHSIGDRWWRISPARGEPAAKALLYRIGAEHYRDRVLIALARSQAKDDDKVWLDMLALPERWSVPRFPLRAADFIARGVAKGPDLGAALMRAEEAWIAAGFPSDPTAVAAIADRAASA